MDAKLNILNQYFGYSSFRAGQEKLIDAQLAGRDAFGVMPTGGGKSLCYQIPALLSDGVTLVVCPLISLMKDQVQALKKVGVPAAYINSSLTPNQIRRAYRNIEDNMYKIIYVAPERLLTDSFLSTISRVHVSIVAVDEAHCISQWGQDFRPSYLHITEFLNYFEHRPVVSAFTATATPQVRDDIIHYLGLQSPVYVVTSFDRPNLRFDVLKPSSKEGTVIKLLQERQDKSGIIYCSTRKDVDNLTETLLDKGFAVTKYHAGLPEAERHENQDDFIYDRRSVMVATNAFGMGIDKSNVAYVIHYNMPQSMEAYYQEAGRAGRDGSEAECILLFSARDIITAKFLIEHSSENEELTDEQKTQVQKQAMQRLVKMISYCRTSKCLRSYILEYFGESHPESCGHCGNCNATMEDFTPQAKIILSCIGHIYAMLGYSVGITMVVRTLSGSREERVLNLNLDTLAEYSQLSKYSRNDLRDMITCLEALGYLRTDPEHLGISLTRRSREVLADGARVTRAVEEKAAKEKKSPEKSGKKLSKEKDPELFAVLKNLRTQIAVEEHVPAYIVFSDATLADMAGKKPASLDDFLQVSGVGSAKAAKYGERFIAEIRNYIAGNPKE